MILITHVSALFVWMCNLQVFAGLGWILLGASGFCVLIKLSLELLISLFIYLLIFFKKTLEGTYLQISIKIRFVSLNTVHINKQKHHKCIN